MSAWQATLDPAIAFLVFGGAGFLARRRGWTDAQTEAQLSRVIYYVTGPLLIFVSTLERLTWPLLLGGLGMVVGGFAVALGGMVLARPIMDRWLRATPVTAGTLAIASAFPNTIFLGLPVTLALVGPQAVPLVVLFDFGANLFLWTWAVSSFQGAELHLWRRPVARASTGTPLARTVSTPVSPNLGQARGTSVQSHLLSPYLVGLVAGTLLAVSGVAHVPARLLTPLRQLGGVTIPLALWVIGSRAAGMSLATWNWRQAGLVTFIRSLVLPGLVMGLVALVLPAHNLLGRVLVIEASMPTMASAVMYAQALSGDAQAAAVAVIATTVVFVMQLPLLSWVVARL
ncbi:MAG: AEC family transporter [Limnochordaceae bacterium]|nr:AEC family transporter [Limnochordaceae bacterium]